MGDRHFRGPQLDDALDRAVRKMTTGEPRPDFEGRVMRRLEPARRQPSAWPRLAAAAAAVAAVVGLGIVLRDGPAVQPSGPRAPVVAARPPAPPPRPPAPTGPPEPPSIVHTGRRQPARAADRRERPETIEAASADEPPIAAVPALHPASALDVEDIEQQTVNVPAITVATLDIGELNVQPLDERREE